MENATVSVGTAEDAKSGFINTRQLLSGFEKTLPVVSMETPAAFTGAVTKVLWYESSSGGADSELPIYDEDDNQIETKVGVDRGIELNVERFIRWPFLMFQLVDVDGVAVQQDSARDFNLVVDTL